jgi:condensin complex subunit 3
MNTLLSEVRRAALLSIPPSPKTVKTLLSRTRDVDPGVRKLLYANVLYETLHHPKQLSIAQRERIVRDGLGDRDPNVRNAAGKLVASWLDTLDGSLEHFLRIFDLVGEPESMSVAEDALKSVFQSRPDIMDNCDFNGTFATVLTSFWG